MILNAQRRTALLFLGALFLLSARAMAYDEKEADKMSEEIKNGGFETVTTKEGLKFTIPSDMPIERKNGLVAPVPFDEYLYIKFKKIEEKQVTIDKKIDELKSLLQDLSKKSDRILSAQEAAKKEATAPAPKNSVQ